ncbi:MAG TPA: hypothetical protein VE964_07390, partial [Myxococcales bacterium]|nr:hypothetical protein [Myxococcales bacterium]
MMRLLVVALASITFAVAVGAGAAEAPPSSVVFKNVRIFDGKSSALTDPTSVLVTGNKIAKI